jgi:hypothetical protein
MHKLFTRKKRRFVRTDGQDTIVVILNWKPHGIASRALEFSPEYSTRSPATVAKRDRETSK